MPARLATRVELAVRADDTTLRCRDLVPGVYHPAWKVAQAALNERLGMQRVVALHELVDACIESLDDTSDDRSPRALDCVQEV